MSKTRKRLIEVAFPLEEVSRHCRDEKKVHHNHISTMHVWWARRPLAACRAFLCASLIDNPDSDAERNQVLNEIADLSSWDAVRHPDEIVRTQEEGGTGLTGTELLRRTRTRILDSNSGQAPSITDPFAGGGAIPLEALRLGCDVHASDLNPVAVLILKGTIEYPQRFGHPDSRPVPSYIRDGDGTLGQDDSWTGPLETAFRENPLSTDVRYWGQWVFDQATKELSEFYPVDADGSRPIAYLWSRTITCPSCGALMPLLRQYWLANEKRPKQIALEPEVDHLGKSVDFKIVEGDGVTGNPENATTVGGDSKCLVCSQIVEGAAMRMLGLEGKISSSMTAAVLMDRKTGKKRYRPDERDDLLAFEAAARRLAALKAASQSEASLVPDEPTPRRLTGGVITSYGFDSFGKLFNDRQLLALVTIGRLIGDAYDTMRESHLPSEYAKAVATYLGLALTRYVDFCSTVTRWKADAEAIVGVISLQSLPMTWDYPEHVATGDGGGSFLAMVKRVAAAIESAVVSNVAAQPEMQDVKIRVEAADSTIITDPPYYDAISYADLSDFFYVWQKRSIGFLHPELVEFPLSPKRDEIVMVSRDGGPKSGKGLSRKAAAMQNYVDGMAGAFRAMQSSTADGTLMGIVFAHTNPDAWATLISGLLRADFVPVASWPIDTEATSGLKVIGQTRLKTSVWMVCRRREETVIEGFLSEVQQEMRQVIRERLLDFWAQGIRGADFFISAIGPAVAVFGRYSEVLEPDGNVVEVRDFLDIVRREATAVALERVLQGAELAQVDSVTQHYVVWVWSYSRSALETGEAVALSLATGARLDDVTREHSIAVATKARSKKVVKLRTIAERAREDDDLGGESSGLATPLIDQLQCAAWLWSQNQGDRLSRYRGALGENRWSALLTLGQAVAECLPEGDEDRRIIHGLLGATVRASEAPSPSPQLTLGMDNGDGTE